MKPSFAVGIPHASWIEERRAVLTAMCAGLEVPRPMRGESEGLMTSRGDRDVIVGVHHHRMPRLMISLYSEVVYRWLVAQDVTHCIFMSDDLTIGPRFWDVVTAIVTAQPDVAIALDALHPKGVGIAKEGRHWYRCKAWLAGPAMLWPKWMLEEHLRWRDQQPLKYIRETGDDSAFNEYLFRTDQDSWHPVPSMVDHDADMSTAQTGIVERVEQFRRPSVLWYGYDLDELAKPETWAVNHPPPLFLVPSEEAKQ